MDNERIQILVSRYLTGEATHQEQAELIGWLNSSDDNVKEFRDLKDAYDLGRFGHDIKYADTAAQWRKLYRNINTSGSKKKRATRLRVSFMRYAAVFIFGAGLAWAGAALLERYGNSDMQLTHIETGVGERTKIILPDSSTVWLNSCSSISYDRAFGRRSRDIKLSGEAFFEVHKDMAKPFVVSSESLDYQVTGTSFNVYSFEEDNSEKLVLVDGSVTIRYGKNRMPVKPGEVVEFRKDARKFVVKNSDPAFYTSWRFGELAFERMTFEELARRLERNFNVTFVFENQQVREETFGGSFRNYDTLETIMKVISTSIHIKYDIEQNTVYIR